MVDPKIMERLRKARTELNQSELAEKLGMSISTYKRLIDGAASFTIETIQKAAKIFKVDEDVITGRKPLFEEPPVEEFRTITRDTTIMVTLDGSKPTLDSWIRRLEAINKAI